MRTKNATDLGIDMGQIADHRSGFNWIYVDGIGPWEMAAHAAAFLGIGLCPNCGGGKLRRNYYCSGCDRTGRDGIAEFPGIAVDAVPNPDWHASASVYDPDPELAGGMGKKVKFRRGVARSRKVG